MCPICRLGQRCSSAQLSTPLLDTRQFSTLIVTDHRRTVTAASPQLSDLEQSRPNHSTRIATSENAFLFLKPKAMIQVLNFLCLQGWSDHR
ncbi:hypothetical protein ACSYAD_19165 [Acaryochloris marina NIES-2412]|uniref:hypothetical protein n=1 Tax=Acaryochloris marina TaxID=155978 RepID=UPI00405950EF